MTRRTANSRVESFETDLGWMAVLTRGETLQQLTFGHATAAEAEAALPANPRGQATVMPDGHHDWRRELIGELIAYASGRPVDFSNIQIDDAECSDFQRRVRSACRRIPYAKLQSYGQLAAAAGSPGAARAVGHVMATNPLPIVIPCHRVVGTAGDVRGYSAGGGVEMRRRLMRLEGAELGPSRGFAGGRRRQIAFARI
jgi:methylated-DNA-[protein]-cysteine S-methyltransferase